MSDYTRFIVRRAENNVTVISLVDRELSDLAMHANLNDEMTELLESMDPDKPKKVLLDLGRVKYCASSAIELFLRFNRNFNGSNDELKLCSLAPVVRETFRVLRLEGTVFDIHDTEEEAIVAFSAVTQD